MRTQGDGAGPSAAGLGDKRFDVTPIKGTPAPGQTLCRSRPVSQGDCARLESGETLLTDDAELALNLPGGHGSSCATTRARTRGLP
ncbi:MAG: hypothetical protein WCH44_14265 [Betaproteobacteria bacterium]